MQRPSITDKMIRPGRGVVRAASDAVALRGLENSRQPEARQIRHAVRRLGAPLPAPEAELISAIEAERRRLLALDTPLVDGSLGPGGLYDSGISIGAACQVSKGPGRALLLYTLIREFHPDRVLELGTNLGISAAYQATALRVNGGTGRMITLEASPYRIRAARELHRKLGLDHVEYVQGLFAETLPEALDRLGQVDFAFIDGHHQYQPTLDYFDLVSAHSRPRAIYVFDDIRWSDGMRDAWARLRADARITVAADFQSMGVCVGRGPGSGKERLATRPIRGTLP